MNIALSKINSFTKSRYLIELLLWLATCVFVSYQITNFNAIKGLVIIFLLVLALSLWKIDWAICLFIFLSPFHFLFKEIYPSIAVDLWREIFFFCILTSWFLQIRLGKILPPCKNILNSIIVAYILWGAMEILRSYNLLTGLAGFRFMFAFVPLYFVTLSTIKDNKEIMRYVNAILISGFIIALIAILQFVLVSILGIVPPGTSIDFVRKYAPSGSYIPAGIGLERAISVLSGANELGNFLFVCLVFIFVFSFYSLEFRAKHYWKLVFSLGIILLGLFLSMSRSSMIGFVTCILAISFLRKGKTSLKKILVATAGIVILALVLPFSLKTLFSPVHTFSDPYFEGIRSEDLWNTFRELPFLGQGFSITGSAAEKLEITELGAVSVGGTDISFLEISMQIGIIGFFLHFLIWFFFLKNAYFGGKNLSLSENSRLTSIAIFGILIGLMVASLHTSPWYYVSLSGTYWVLGAVATFCYQEAKKVEGQ